MNWIGLRGLAWFLVQKDVWDGVPEEEIWTPRVEWQPFEPHLLAEGKQLKHTAREGYLG